MLPKIGGYEVVAELQEMSDGARNTRLVRRYHAPCEGERQTLLNQETRASGWGV